MTTFSVQGLPISQGSKRPLRNKYSGRIQMVESSEKLKPWRELVALTASQAMSGPPFKGPVSIVIRFRFPRPRSHYGTGRNHGTVKASAPFVPIGKPDLDKLQRAVFDALTHVIWLDDAQVVDVVASKVYDDTPGILVIVDEVTNDGF
jgi:Holliday junction resolvase RusA-like endonuclease